MTPRERLLFTLRLALRKVPPGLLRALAQRRRPGDELAETIVAETILAQIELANLELREGAPGRAHRTP